MWELIHILPLVVVFHLLACSLIIVVVLVPLVVLVDIGMGVGVIEKRQEA